MFVYFSKIKTQKKKNTEKMVDEFMVCVDRLLLTTACFDTVTVTSNQQQRQQQQHHHHDENDKYEEESTVENGTVPMSAMKKNKSKSIITSKKEMLIECKICQEEDQITNMESPCACNGTLKFAHRKCIQRWCNKKGDITCEICSQVFSPNYSLPPKINPEVMAIDIRQAWGSHIELHDSHILALAAAERRLFQQDCDDYALASSSSVACLRSVAIILLVILLVRQCLMVTKDAGMVQASHAIFHLQISILQCAGFLLPCYVLARSWYIMQGRRRRQG